LHSFILPLPQPTDFAHLATRIAQSSHGAFYRYKDGKIGRILRVGTTPRFVEVGLVTGAVSVLEIVVHQGHPSEQECIARQIVHLYSLEFDLSEFYYHAQHDEVLARVIEHLQGARMIRDSDLFSSVISTIISQQINLKIAAELKRRLWALAGEEVIVDGELFYADPTPENIAQLSYEKLRALQYSQRKAEYVIDFARLVASGKLDLLQLSTLNDAEFITELTKLRGLGRWTAECVLLFGLGRPDLLPANDIGLQNAVTRLWRLPERISEQELRKKASFWHPYSSWYTYYLWLSLALGKDDLS